MKKNIRVKLWGVRGSIPTPGHRFAKFGGNTTCIEVSCGNEHFVIDAGSGIRGLGIELLPRMPIRTHLLFTHYHWDHIMGLPYFAPAFIPGNEINIYGEEKKGLNVKKILAGQMVFPYFPVGMDLMGAKMKFRKVKAGDRFKFGDVTVTTNELHHPFGAVGYRFDYNGSSFVHVCDYEHYPHPDEGLRDWIHGAGGMYYDAAYTPQEYKNGKQGWGHSTYEEACKLADECKVEKVLLSHHDPAHDDNFMADVEEKAKALFRKARVAREDEELWF